MKTILIVVAVLLGIFFMLFNIANIVLGNDFMGAYAACRDGNDFCSSEMTVKKICIGYTYWSDVQIESDPSASMAIERCSGIGFETEGVPPL